MKYRIYGSTSRKFNGIEFECNCAELCASCLDEAINYALEEDKIERKGDTYVYGDSHIILLIKEVI